MGITVTEESYQGEETLAMDNDIIIIIIIIITILKKTFGIINWYQGELQKLDRKTTKLLTIHGQHHPKQI